MPLMYRRVSTNGIEIYPECIALRIGHCGRKVTCIYSDNSLYVWDISDFTRIGRCRSLLFHNGAVWGVEVSV
jgi:hypothetical protein